MIYGSPWLLILLNLTTPSSMNILFSFTPDIAVKYVVFTIITGKSGRRDIYSLAWDAAEKNTLVRWCTICPSMPDPSRRIFCLQLPSRSIRYKLVARPLFCSIYRWSLWSDGNSWVRCLGRSLQSAVSHTS